MHLLATIKPSDIEAVSPKFDYDSFVDRAAVRAVIFDGMKVALIYVGKHDYYMLPGGGVEDENFADGLRREVNEEIGCEIEMIGEVGAICVYMDRWARRQTDYCYVAKKVGATTAIRRTDFEVEEGHDIVWVDNLEAAIGLVEAARPHNRDGKLVRARDLLFLKNVQSRKDS